MKVKGFIFFAVLALGLSSAPSALSSQGLFEQAEKGGNKGLVFELNGFIRGALFAGKTPGEKKAEIKSSYGEMALKLMVRKQNLGNAYAEVRVRKGMEFDHSVSELSLREAYVNAYLGPVDLRIGHQIVAWGRADGFNPTDNITPQNALTRSADEDDRRTANFLLRSFLNLYPVRIESIWIPVYQSSVIPFDFLPLPENISLNTLNPGLQLQNSAFAFKLHLLLPSLEGSISYFNGFLPSPGLYADLANPLSPDGQIMVFLKPFRMHILGADFSTTVAGSVGLRGEIAYRKPHDDYKTNLHIPNPDIYYVIGLDKELVENLSLIFQYSGRYVLDYKPLVQPVDPMLDLQYQLALKNRLINYQQYKFSHSFFGELGWKLLYETLNLELAGMVNITSREVFIRPKLVYDISDAFTFTLGGELYLGPEDSLYDAIASYLGAVYMEFKMSF
jgi:hypothetical protein